MTMKILSSLCTELGDEAKDLYLSSERISLTGSSTHLIKF